MSLAAVKDMGHHEVKYAKIVGAASADTVVAAAVSGKRIVVISYIACSTGNVSVKFGSFDGSSTYTDLTGVMVIKGSSDSGLDADWNPDGHFQTLVGEALTINNAHGSNVVGGHLTYYET